jgi:hypothetical protein
MKKLLALSLIGSSLLIGSNSLKSEEYDAFGIDYSGDASIGNRIYGVDTADGSISRIIYTKCIIFFGL